VSAPSLEDAHEAVREMGLWMVYDWACTMKPGESTESNWRVMTAVREGGTKTIAACTSREAMEAAYRLLSS